MRNDKGSVLSVAIILVMFLSFSITSITAHTQRISTRTNTTISVRDDEFLGDTYLKLAMRQFADTVSGSGYNDFTELEDYNILFPLLEDIKNDFDVDVTLLEGGDFVRKYRFSYYIESLDQTIFKDLVASVELLTVQNRDYSKIFDDDGGIIDKFLENFDMDEDSGDKVYCHSDYDGEEDLDVCRRELLKDIRDGGKTQLLSGDFYLGADFEVDAQDTQLTLNNNVLIIDGNFDISKFESIEGGDGSGDGRGGIIIVTKDLIGIGNHGVKMSNLLILVKGDIHIEFDHPRNADFAGENFVIFGYSSSFVYSSSTVDGSYESDGIGDYYTNTITNLPGQNVKYVGSDPYTDIDTILEHYLSDLSGDVAYVYDFFY